MRHGMEVISQSMCKVKCPNCGESVRLSSSVYEQRSKPNWYQSTYRRRARQCPACRVALRLAPRSLWPLLLFVPLFALAVQIRNLNAVALLGVLGALVLFGLCRSVKVTTDNKMARPHDPNESRRVQDCR